MGLDNTFLKYTLKTNRTGLARWQVYLRNEEGDLSLQEALAEEEQTNGCHFLNHSDLEWALQYVCSVHRSRSKREGTKGGPTTTWKMEPHKVHTILALG